MKNIFSRLLKAHLLQTGDKVLLLGIGPIISEALKAKEQLLIEGIDLGVCSMGSIKPLDEKFLKDRLAENYTHWISFEEHHKIGGLGSTLLEWLSENKEQRVQLTRMGIADNFIHHIGSQNYVRERESLGYTSIMKIVRSLWHC